MSAAPKWEPVDNDTAEVWRPIPTYAGLYEASSRGRIRSVDRIVPRPTGAFPMKGRVVRQGIHPRGYRQVRLYRAEGGRTMKVHTLVALAFYGSPESGQEVRHLNDDKSDNRAANLRWGTRRENMLDRGRNGIDPNRNKTHCPQGHPYDAQNTKVNSAGYRECKTCNIAKDRRYKARKRSAA